MIISEKDIELQMCNLLVNAEAHGMLFDLASRKDNSPVVANSPVLLTRERSATDPNRGLTSHTNSHNAPTHKSSPSIRLEDTLITSSMERVISIYQKPLLQ